MSEPSLPYEPTPLDTSNVKLTPDVLQLTELLARNAHEIWARQRLQDGWRYGPRRDDARKLHPCLVPYDELPESEKVYDRNAAMETLKAMTILGYRVARLGSPGHRKKTKTKVTAKSTAARRVARSKRRTHE